MPGLLPTNAHEADLGIIDDLTNPDNYSWLKPSSSPVSNEWAAAQFAFAQSVELQQMAQDFNAQQAALNRQWQEKMSSTSYQRAIADLKKAGLNPALAITNLSGATTGHGSAASVNATSGFKPNTAGELGAVLGFVSEMFKIFQNSNSGQSFSKLSKSSVESNDVSLEGLKRMLDDL